MSLHDMASVSALLLIGAVYEGAERAASFVGSSLAVALWRLL